MPDQEFFVPDERQRARFAAPLDAAALRRALAAEVEVCTVRQTGSTHADLLARVRQAAPARPLLLAAVE